MSGWCGDRVVIDIEDAPLSREVRAPEFSGREHPPRRNVVTEGLDLQRAVAKDIPPASTAKHVIGVDVQAALRQHKAQAEIVATHRGMPTLCKRGEFPLSITVSYVGSGRRVAEHVKREA